MKQDKPPNAKTKPPTTKQLTKEIPIQLEMTQYLEGLIHTIYNEISSDQKIWLLRLLLITNNSIVKLYLFDFGAWT